MYDIFWHDEKCNEMIDFIPLAVDQFGGVNMQFKHRILLQEWQIIED